jgi:hypothetical protein
MKLEFNNKRKKRKYSNPWRTSNPWRANKRVIEEIRK